MANEPFVVAKRKIGAKIESTPYTFDEPAASDFDFRAFNISFTPEFEEYARKYATCDFSAFSSIIGKRMITVSFSVDLADSGIAATPPEYSKLLKGCALKETVHGATGVSYVTNADYGNVPLSFEVVLDPPDNTVSQLVYQIRGAMGNVSFNLDAAGQPVRMDFEFSGVVHDIIDRAQGSAKVPTGFDETEPDPVLSSTITAFGDARAIDTMSIDLGNTVEMYVDPSTAQGLRGAYVVNREPTATLDPYMDLIANSDDYGRWIAGTTGEINVTISASLQLYAPAFQITGAYGAGDRGGLETNALSGPLTRNAGNDEFKLLQGSES